MKGPKEKRRLAVSTMLDASTPPEVLRAHAIRDTIAALVHHGAIELIQNDERDAIAAELGVPALWIDAAQEQHTVSLELLHEFGEWEARVLRPFVERGKAVQ
jgi:hypothetical protein